VGEREYSLKNKAGFSRASRSASAKKGDKGKAEECREATPKRAETIKRQCFATLGFVVERR
jgi:hypothetical protein